MKEKEISAIAAKIEDEQSLGSKMQKQVDDDNDDCVYDNSHIIMIDDSIMMINVWSLWQ